MLPGNAGGLHIEKWLLLQPCQLPAEAGATSHAMWCFEGVKEADLV